MLAKVGFDLGTNGIPRYVVSQLGYNTPTRHPNLPDGPLLWRCTGSLQGAPSAHLSLYFRSEA